MGPGMPVSSRGMSVCRDHVQGARGVIDDGRVDRGCGEG